MLMISIEHIYMQKYLDDYIQYVLHQFPILGKISIYINIKIYYSKVYRKQIFKIYLYFKNI